jgi:hypothetical protein
MQSLYTHITVLTAKDEKKIGASKKYRPGVQV